MGHGPNEADFNDLRSRIFALEQKEEVRKATTNFCKNCHCIYEYRRRTIFEQGWGDLEYCYHCLPEENRKRELTEWVRNNPDSAEECKKKHERETK